MNQKTKDIKPSPPAPSKEGSLSQLNRGLMVLNIQREMEEPAYAAMDRITKNRKVISRRQEYCSDLERTIDEAKMTIVLLSEVQQEKKVGEKIHPPEEVINYYNGIFLDQVHQIKDKLFRLVALMLLVPEQAQDNQKKDPKKIDYKPFMNKYAEVLKDIKIYDLLAHWGAGNLAIALQKRTNHHHFVSTLRLNEDLQKVAMSRLALHPLTSDRLTEYGKKRMAEIGEESFNKWREALVKKLQQIIEEIETNIEQIAECLIVHFNIPITAEDVAPIVNKYTAFLSSFDIHNQTSISKVDPLLQPLIDGLLEIAKNEIGGKLNLLYSVYLVGSVARGEFIPGSSDINIYFIIDTDTDTSISTKEYPLINVVFLSKKKFFLDEHLKDRFICWSDGLLIHGEKLEMNKSEFPKPGTLLTLLLNRDSIEELLEIKSEVTSLKKPKSAVLRQYSLRTAKIMLDFDFGVAMANKPFYTASRKRKIAYTKEQWPNERRTTTLEQIYYKGTIRQEDFTMLIDTFLENAKRNYQKMLKIEAEINKTN